MAHGHHIIPTRVLATVFGALVFLTILTVATSRMDLGAMDVPVALAIATLKAGLVVAFFMALKYDNRVNSLVFAVGSLFVLVFLAFTLLDTMYRGDLPNTVYGTIMEQEAEEAALQARQDAAAAGSATPAESAPESQGTESGSEGTEGDGAER